MGLTASEWTIIFLVGLAIVIYYFIVQKRGGDPLQHKGFKVLLIGLVVAFVAFYLFNFSINPGSGSTTLSLPMIVAILAAMYFATQGKVSWIVAAAMLVGLFVLNGFSVTVQT